MDLERYEEERQAQMQQVLGKVLQDSEKASKKREREMSELRHTIAQADGLSWFLGAVVLLALGFAAVCLPYMVMDGDFSGFEELNVLASLGAACLLWILLRRIRD